MSELAWTQLPRIPSAAELSDDDVVRRVRAGETQLFEILMRRYNRRLYRVARGILGRDDEAVDVLQEAYVRAFTHLAQFDGRALFSTWLTRILMHEAWTRARRARRFVPLDTEHQPVSIAVPGEVDPERQAHTRQLRALLERSIDALPAIYRAVFVMRDVERLTTRQVAELLAIDTGLVKVRLQRAREKLRRDLLRRARAASQEIFNFGFERCDGVVARVMRRVGQVGNRGDPRSAD